ncbi:serine hydrolase domain-containing protein [Bombilactobacillus bombi]|uniref:serine hydrolase domain-containing protein n=1 Tax=Bombilactobacillus bombi TaxID=1303590 RepID=UPI0015E628BD|nr:serine hydrolase domain-containing protein [Bombilactobacillus bombi]
MKTLRTICSILFLLLFIGTSSHVATASTQKTIVKLLKHNQYSGSLLIIKHGKIWQKNNFGYADYEQRRLNTSKSVYQLASLEKSITATLLIKAQTQHKLKLSDSLHSYFPNIPYSANLTLKHLMQMQSGLVLSNKTSTNLSTKRLDYYLNHATRFDKNYVNRWHYSDVNYILLARILAKVNHCSYQELFNRYFKQPLHLKNTNVDDNYELNPYHTTGYDVQEQPANYTNPLTLDTQRLDFELGAGQLYANVQEFYHLQAAIVQGKIVPQKVLQIYRQVPPTNQGNGYNGGVYNDAQNHYFYAHGVEQGFDTVFVMANNGKNAVILFSNRHNPAMTNTIDLAKDIYQMVITK